MGLNKLVIPTLATLLGCALLVGLGVWQLQRLQWKRDLVARLEASAAASPVALAEALKRWRGGGDIEHLRVRFSGEFLHGGELHLYSLAAGGRPGWRVITPMRLEGGAIVLVDRGFVPAQLKSPESRPQGQIEGRAEVTGQIRLAAARGAFTPDNDPVANEWYWRDLGAMARAGLAHPAGQRVLPFFVESEEAPVPGGWPRGGAVTVMPSNRHLGYAVTWFGLAVVLLAVYAVVVRNSLKRS